MYQEACVAILCRVGKVVAREFDNNPLGSEHKNSLMGTY